MKQWIILILVYGVLTAAPLYEEKPVETIMMGTFDENGGDNHLQPPSGNVTVEEEVISAEEYLKEEEMPGMWNSKPAVETVSAANIRLEKPKIALLVPRKVIGAYANSVANAILSYLLYNKQHFILEVFDSGTQSEDDLLLALQKMRHKGFRLIVAPLTAEGANRLAKIAQDVIVYVPTVNIDDMHIDNPNFLYGGIDYKAQVDALLQYAEHKIVVFGDGSALAKKISDYIHESRFEDIVFTKEIPNVKANLSYLLKRNSKLKNAAIFLNMPVVKSALLAAQMSRYKVPYKRILSTQVNYSPLLFTLTQRQDRERFFIANAIGNAPFALQDINDLIGSDIRYNWINYASSVGVDYILTDLFGLRSGRLFSEELFAQQLYYDTRIVKPEEGGFRHVDLVNATPEPATDALP